MSYYVGSRYYSTTEITLSRYHTLFTGRKFLNLGHGVCWRRTEEDFTAWVAIFTLVHWECLQAGWILSEGEIFCAKSNFIDEEIILSCKGNYAEHVVWTLVLGTSCAWSRWRFHSRWFQMLVYKWYGQYVLHVWRIMFLCIHFTLEFALVKSL